MIGKKKKYIWKEIELQRPREPEVFAKANISEEKTWIYNLLSRPFRLRPLCCTANLKSYEFKTKRRREEVKIPYFNFPWSKVASWGPKSHSPYKKNKNTNFVKYNRKGNNRNSTIGLLGQSPCFGISFLFTKKKSWRCGWDCVRLGVLYGKSNFSIIQDMTVSNFCALPAASIISVNNNLG